MTQEKIYVIKRQSSWKNQWFRVSNHKSYETALKKLDTLEGVHKIESEELFE